MLTQKKNNHFFRFLRFEPETFRIHRKCRKRPHMRRREILWGKGVPTGLFW
jgi:hypothetical protein